MTWDVPTINVNWERFASSYGSEARWLTSNRHLEFARAAIRRASDAGELCQWQLETIHKLMEDSRA